MRSSSPSSSDSGHSSPSTAPSTPPPGHSGCYFLVCDGEGVLKDIPASRASGDRVLFFQGSGSVKGLLTQAADVLDDKTLLDDARWEYVSADSGAYYKIKTDISTVEKSDVSLESIACKTQQVRPLISVRVAAF